MMQVNQERHCPGIVLGIENSKVVLCRALPHPPPRCCCFFAHNGSGIILPAASYVKFMFISKF